MQTKTETLSRPRNGASRRVWRIALAALIVLPFLPELVIYAASALAWGLGCRVEQKTVCLIGSVPASDIIAAALQTAVGMTGLGASTSSVWLAVFYAAVVIWLVICFTVVTMGWTRTPSRILIAFAVGLVFAVLPYFGPMLAIGALANSNCQPNEGGVGSCLIYGGYVGGPDHSPAHDAVTLGWLVFFGAPLAFAAFVAYAIFAIVIGIVRSRRTVASGQ